MTPIALTVSACVAGVIKCCAGPGPIQTVATVVIWLWIAFAAFFLLIQPAYCEFYFWLERRQEDKARLEKVKNEIRTYNTHGK